MYNFEKGKSLSARDEISVEGESLSTNFEKASLFSPMMKRHLMMSLYLPSSKNWVQASLFSPMGTLGSDKFLSAKIGKFEEGESLSTYE